MGKFAEASHPIHPDVAGKVRILAIDIETSPLLIRRFGTHKQAVRDEQIVEDERILCYAARWYGSKRMIFRSEFHDGPEKMMADLYGLLDQADALLHFNGAAFDIPKIRGALAVDGYTPWSTTKNIDLYHAAKTFGFSKTTLRHVCRKFGIGEKLKTDGFETWLKVLAGDEKAWRDFRRYCCTDTALLEPLYDRIRPWIGNHPNLALYAGDDERRCRLCGNAELERSGEVLTAVTKYPGYRCSWCGATSMRSKHRMAASQLTRAAR